MTNTKFVVKVTRSGGLASRYIQRMDRTPVLMTTNRKLALLMGRLTAEEAVLAIQSSRCTADLVPVAIAARRATGVTIPR